MKFPMRTLHSLCTGLAVLVLASLFSAPPAYGETQVLSAYFGATILPPGAVMLCPGNGGFPPGPGFGGMPFVLTSQIQAGFDGDRFALDPANFTVTVGPSGNSVMPICATLQPAVNGGELRTILLAGPFGIGGDNMPTEIGIVGDVFTVSGESLNGLVIDNIFAPNTGPLLELAEVFDTADGVIQTSGPGKKGVYCPSGRTAKVVKLTFSGGVSGPNGGVLRDDAKAIAAIRILGMNSQGNRVPFNPFALRDDDNDNHLDACIGPVPAYELELVEVSVDSHNFFAPMNAPNPVGTVPIQKGFYIRKY